MNYYIITGTSRGLGEAIAIKLLKKGNHVIGISRTVNNSLIKIAAENECKLNYIEFDLSVVNKLDEMMAQVFEMIHVDEADKVCLVNNAGVVVPINPLDNCGTQEIINSYSINAIAPVVITSNFIAKLKETSCEKRIINISSGAGKNPYDGWSCYCSTKSALDMVTRCVALEQEKEEYPVKILSFAPGVLDTDMQKKIRQTSTRQFSKLEKFIGLKESGNLLPVEYAADKIVQLLDDDQFIQGGVIDIRD